METLDVTIHLAFAFDIGYEIDLEQARALLPGETGPPARRRRSPESIRYRPAPLRVAIDAAGMALPGSRPTIQPPRAELTAFDFGALSLTVQFPARMTPEELLTLAGDLAEPAPLNEAARRILSPLIDRLRPAVSGLEVSALSEEYILFQVDNAHANWIADHPDWVAGLIRLDPEPLSETEIAEANRLAISYTPTDLVTLDWAAGFVADRDCADTLQVIEFANVQLLEFRHIDDRLDDRLEAAYKLIGTGQQRRWTFPSWRMHGAAMRNVRELEIEATSLFERADNALKLIGDQYLSRVFELASTRFHLRDWQQSIRRKLDTVGDVYDLLVQQSGVIRMETLEIIVILLIGMEIVLAFYRH